VKRLSSETGSSMIRPGIVGTEQICYQTTPVHGRNPARPRLQLWISLRKRWRTTTITATRTDPEGWAEGTSRQAYPSPQMGRGPRSAEPRALLLTGARVRGSAGKPPARSRTPSKSSTSPRSSPAPPSSGSSRPTLDRPWVTLKSAGAPNWVHRCAAARQVCCGRWALTL
jgi:hypothetical protein